MKVLLIFSVIFLHFFCIGGNFKFTIPFFIGSRKTNDDLNFLVCREAFQINRRQNMVSNNVSKVSKVNNVLNNLSVVNLTSDIN